MGLQCSLMGKWGVWGSDRLEGNDDICISPALDKSDSSLW